MTRATWSVSAYCWTDASEHAVRHGLRPDVGIAVRIRKILGFIPDDGRTHPPEHARAVDLKARDLVVGVVTVDDGLTGGRCDRGHLAVGVEAVVIQTRLALGLEAAIPHNNHVTMKRIASHMM